MNNSEIIRLHELIFYDPDMKSELNQIRHRIMKLAAMAGVTPSKVFKIVVIEFPALVQ